MTIWYIPLSYFSETKTQVEDVDHQYIDPRLVGTTDWWLRFLKHHPVISTLPWWDWIDSAVYQVSRCKFSSVTRGERKEERAVDGEWRAQHTGHLPPGAKHKASESYTALHLFPNSRGQEPWPPFSIMSETFISLWVGLNLSPVFLPQAPNQLSYTWFYLLQTLLDW